MESMHQVKQCFLCHYRVYALAQTLVHHSDGRLSDVLNGEQEMSGRSMMELRALAPSTHHVSQGSALRAYSRLCASLSCDICGKAPEDQPFSSQSITSSAGDLGRLLLCDAQVASLQQSSGAQSDTVLRL